MIILVLFRVSYGLTVTSSPSGYPTATQSVITGSTLTFSWTVAAETGTTDCTLSTYAGLLRLSTLGTAVLHDTYLTATDYQKVRLSGTGAQITSTLSSVTYKPHYYYVTTSYTFTAQPVTDYLELVCRDTAMSAESLNIIGLDSGWVPFCLAGNECSNGGNCNPLTGACDCYYPYSGTTCTVIDCGYCHNTGSCNTATGICNCPSYAYGDNCEYLYCPKGSSSTNCNNHGYCDPYSGICNCFDGYQGFDCSNKKCLNDCSNGGVCSNAGVCTCYAGFYGTDCSSIRCPRDCGAFGGCNYATGECYCFGSFAEKDCMFSPCPTTLTGICNLNGVCNYYSGLCTCDAGHAGVDCSL